MVGSGNSGMEISLDLANHGANTFIVIRSPVNIILSYTETHTQVLYDYLMGDFHFTLYFNNADMCCLIINADSYSF